MCGLSEKWLYRLLTELSVHLLRAPHTISSRELLIRQLYKFIIWPVFLSSPPHPDCLVLIFIIVLFFEPSASALSLTYYVFKFGFLPWPPCFEFYWVCPSYAVLLYFFPEVEYFQSLCYWCLGMTVSLLKKLASVLLDVEGYAWLLPTKCQQHSS